ncbi:MAG: universal stress protein [Maribacter sp.]
MQRVLVITDFSENTHNALSYAAVLFEKGPATFYLLNIYENLKGDSFEGNYFDIGAVESDSKLDNLLKNFELENQNHRHSYRTISKPVPFVDAVKKAVFLHDIDLIVMATKGSKGVFETFMDANAVKLVNTLGTLPIILVPKDFKSLKPSQIVFFTDFTRAFNRKELRALVLLVKLLGSKIKVIHFTADEQMDEFQRMNKGYFIEIFVGLDYSFEKINWIVSKTEAIKQYVEQIGSGMISLVNHKYNFLYRLTRENIVKKVAFDSEVPILVLPELEGKKSVPENGAAIYKENL